MACLTFRRGLIGVSPSNRRFCKLDNLQSTDVRQPKPPCARACLQLSVLFGLFGRAKLPAGGSAAGRQIFGQRPKSRTVKT